VGGSSRSSLNNDASSFSDPAIPSAVNDTASRLSLGQRESGDVGGSSRQGLLKVARDYSDPLLSNKAGRRAADTLQSNVGGSDVGKEAKKGVRKASKALSGSSAGPAQSVKDAAEDAADSIQGAASSAQKKIMRRITFTPAAAANPVVDNLAAVTMGGRSSYNDPAVSGAVNDTASKLSLGQRESGDVGGNSRESLNNDASSFSDPAVPSAINRAANKLSIGQRTSGDVGGSSPSALQEQNQSYSDPLLSNKAVSYRPRGWCCVHVEVD
jgi:hypothetical protein